MAILNVSALIGTAACNRSPSGAVPSATALVPSDADAAGPAKMLFGGGPHGKRTFASYAADGAGAPMMNRFSMLEAVVRRSSFIDSFAVDSARQRACMRVEGEEYCATLVANYWVYIAPTDWFIELPAGDAERGRVLAELLKINDRSKLAKFVMGDSGEVSLACDLRIDDWSEPAMEDALQTLHHVRTAEKAILPFVMVRR